MNLIFLCVGCIPLLTGFRGKETKHVRNDVAMVYYFIDADCEKCSVKEHDDSRVWVVTKDIQAAEWKDNEGLLKKFQDTLASQLNADSELISRSVFRFQDSEQASRRGYFDKEQKMKMQGYTIIKINF